MNKASFLHRFIKQPPYTCIVSPFSPAHLRYFITQPPQTTASYLHCFTTRSFLPTSFHHTVKFIPASFNLTVISYELYQLYTISPHDRFIRPLRHLFTDSLHGHFMWTMLHFYTIFKHGCFMWALLQPFQIICGTVSPRPSLILPH